MLFHAAAAYDAKSSIDALWLLIAAALVLLMTPGVAFF
jgi:Amt family ammonium transporter